MDRRPTWVRILSDHRFNLVHDVVCLVATLVTLEFNCFGDVDGTVKGSRDEIYRRGHVSILKLEGWGVEALVNSLIYMKKSAIPRPNYKCVYTSSWPLLIELDSS